ncbi:MAG: NCS1 family nucleobase:cation symporter-1 [Bacteroidia bacterium]|nr:NCS1 family nucleobase:cation symporter-1 [Bacteroidia bacterium]
MKEEIVELQEQIAESALYSEDLAPVPAAKRTWSMWNLAFIWVGMAVCIPTYMLASYMIKSGLSWQAALVIIGLANVVITIPMALNGHAGVKFGIPFPVLGRASFGIYGIHIPSIVRAIVACGWFGIQTWIGGLAIYAIFNAAVGSEGNPGLDIGKFVAFGIFWVINMYFVWKGTESIKWLEEYSAPILVLMGIALIIWGMVQAGGFGIVLEQSKQLDKPVASLSLDENEAILTMNPIRNADGRVKATHYRVGIPGRSDGVWVPLQGEIYPMKYSKGIIPGSVLSGREGLNLDFKYEEGGKVWKSSPTKVMLDVVGEGEEGGSQWWSYILWFTAMVGFWATMALSISDITRYTTSQKAQVGGQFIGLPGTMILYSFVGIFVTCAAVINFKDVLIAPDAPWDPVSLISKFESPWVVIIAQIFMLIATLSTNIAANVIAPANAFSNLNARAINFKMGGTITGLIGILTCPWWIMDEISGILIFVSGLLGPVLAILICDYFLIRKTNLDLAELFKTEGKYTYSGGFNISAMIALLIGIVAGLIGKWVPALDFLYSLSWFTGFFVAFVVYYLLMFRTKSLEVSPES